MFLRPPSILQVPISIAAMAVSAFGGWLVWRGRPPPSVSEVHGTAHFGDHQKARKTLGGEGLIVGRSDRGWLMRYAGPSHLLTIAPTRSGKGVGAIIPNLLTADRAVLCIDPKGENAAATVRARAKYGPVHVLDPFETSGFTSACFNPLSRLDPESLDVGEEAALIAETLVYDPPDQISEAHWNEEAKALLTGFILHAVASPYAARRNLAHVRELITSTPERLGLEFRAMQASGAARGLVARAANRHLAKADREAAGVLSAAQRHTHFLDSPRMTRLLSQSDFSFDELRAAHATVFLVLPPDRLATHARWLRLMVAHALDSLAKARTGADDTPILFLLDEFAALGRLEPVERAFGLMAGYGVQLWPILQDLHQLRAAYGQSAGTFLSNAGILQIFNVADIDTATWVSRMLGSMTEMYLSSGSTTTYPAGQSDPTTGSSTSLNLAKRDLLTPDEVMRIDANLMLVLRPGEAPLGVRKVRYFADPEFQGLFDSGRPVAAMAVAP
ncbi:MAG: type IV secretory system conjugative DNA transfer family protein [Phenylobacterium sp.]|nr:MAG: type IV secretory system conjugative DNA transfer family protein [Phenylobacterium sp.]